MRQTQASVLRPALSQFRQAFRIDEAAAMLACSKRLIYKLVESGDMDALKLSNTSGQRTFMRIPRTSIDKFLNDPKRRVV